MNSGPTLLLTRPAPQSEAFLDVCAALAGKPLKAVVSPLLEIVPVGEVPDLDRFGTVIVTSGNAVRRLGRTLAGRRVVTVGHATADLARAEGAEARALGEDLEAFFASLETISGPALHCRGVHARGDLAGRLRAAGIEAEEAVIYDQRALPLNQAARALLGGVPPVVAPLFSPRSAALLAAEGPFRAPVTVVAMSGTVAEAWTGGGTVTTAEASDAGAMARAVVGEIRRATLLGGGGDTRL